MTETPELRDVSVLVIDDDHDIREALVDILEDAGFSVATARHGAEALQLLKSAVRPSLILLDLNMPVMNGHEFRAAQQAIPALARIPTIVMSAADRLQEQAASMDVSEVLAKPVKLADLMALALRYAGGGA